MEQRNGLAKVPDRTDKGSLIYQKDPSQLVDLLNLLSKLLLQNVPYNAPSIHDHILHESIHDYMGIVSLV